MRRKPDALLAALVCAVAACSGARKDEDVTSKLAAERSALASAEDDCNRIIADGEARVAEIRKDESLSPSEKDIAVTRIIGQGGACWWREEPPGTPADPRDISDDLAQRYATALDAARSVGAAEGECRSAIGSENADALEAICMQVSGATHPPCNAANSCDLLVGEVDRNCVGDMARDYPKLCSTARVDEDTR